MDFDGASSLQGARASVLLVAPSGEHLMYVVHMHFSREVATSNTSEYEGLIVGLRIVAELGIEKLMVRLAARRQASQQGLREPVDEGLRR